MKKCDGYKVLPGFFDRKIKVYVPDYFMCEIYGEECDCDGCAEKCTFNHLKMSSKEETATTIYYAHHQWKYGTKTEEYELNLIKRFFPHAKIFNPATDFGNSFKDLDEESIMKKCIDAMNKSDIVIFSSMDGAIGAGCYEEVMTARAAGKLVLYIYQNKLHTNFHLVSNFDEPKSDRVFAFVNLGKED